MFPKLRLLMMLFMLFGMAGSLGLTASAAPTTADQTGIGAFVDESTVELCYALEYQSKPIAEPGGTEQA